MDAINNLLCKCSVRLFLCLFRILIVMKKIPIKLSRQDIFTFPIGSFFYYAWTYHTSYVFNAMVHEQMYFNGCTKMYMRSDWAKCRKLKWLKRWIFGVAFIYMIFISGIRRITGTTTPVNEERTELCLRQTEHTRSNLWQIHFVSTNQGMVTTVSIRNYCWTVSV
jgi:hypothetical protein